MWFVYSWSQGIVKPKMSVGKEDDIYLFMIQKFIILYFNLPPQKQLPLSLQERGLRGEVLIPTQSLQTFMEGHEESLLQYIFIR